MRTVYKYTLAVVREQTVFMPHGAFIRRTAWQSAGPTIWAEVDTDQPDEERMILIIGTGEKFPDVSKIYLDTVFEDPFVWHIYERIV